MPHRSSSACNGEDPLRVLVSIALGMTALLAVLITGCDEPTGAGAGPRPLLLRAVVPDQEIVVDSTQPFDLVLTFNRTVEPEEFRLDFLPWPAAMGTLAPVGTGRTHVLPGLRLEAEPGVQQVLLISPRLDAPLSIYWFTRPNPPGAGIAGRLRIDPGGPTDPRGTVVFALPAFSTFNPLDLQSFVGATKARVTVVEERFIDGAGSFLLPHLETRPYLVVAVKDTDGDLAWDPRYDWWTYAHPRGELAPIPVPAPTGGLELVLHPPAWTPKGEAR